MTTRKNLQNLIATIEKSAIGKAVDMNNLKEDGRHRVIYVNIEDGIVQNVEYIPEGWNYEIIELEHYLKPNGEVDYESILPDPNTIQIQMYNGVLDNIANLPEGWMYQLEDADVMDDGIAEHGETLSMKKASDFSQDYASVVLPRELMLTDKYLYSMLGEEGWEQLLGSPTLVATFGRGDFIRVIEVNGIALIENTEVDAIWAPYPEDLSTTLKVAQEFVDEDIEKQTSLKSLGNYLKKVGGYGEASSVWEVGYNMGKGLVGLWINDGRTPMVPIEISDTMLEDFEMMVEDELLTEENSGDFYEGYREGYYDAYNKWESGDSIVSKSSLNCGSKTRNNATKMANDLLKLA